MTDPKPLTTARVDASVRTSEAPAKWITTQKALAPGSYAELIQDVKAMEAEIERYASTPASDFTRLDDFLAETDG